MKCVFDHYALLYMLEQFPRNIAEELWISFDTWCSDGTIISQREAQKCLEREAIELASLEWSKNRTSMFKPINGDEAQMLGRIMDKNEFDFLNNPRLAERRMPEAIPFILCMAKTQDRYYVYRKNTNTDYFNKITNICKAYDIKRIEVEECLLELHREQKK
jgi:hypothetical protein